MDGVDVVIHAAGHYPAVSLDPEGTLTLGLRQMRSVLDAAATAGVRRLLYVSSTATTRARPDRPSDERDVWTSRPGIGVYHDLKWAMEAMAEAEDRLEVVTVCPAACLGVGDARVGTCAIVVALARGLAVPHADGVVSIVDAADVGAALARLVLHPAPPRRLLLSGGSYPFHPLMERLAVRYGVAPPPAPLEAAIAQALALEEEHRATSEGRRPALSRELVDLVVHGARLDTSLAERVLPMPWSTLEQTLDRFDGWARRLGLVPRAPPPHPRPSPSLPSPSTEPSP